MISHFDVQRLLIWDFQIETKIRFIILADVLSSVLTLLYIYKWFIIALILCFCFEWLKVMKTIKLTIWIILVNFKLDPRLVTRTRWVALANSIKPQYCWLFKFNLCYCIFILGCLVAIRVFFIRMWFISLMSSLAR